MYSKAAPNCFLSTLTPGELQFANDDNDDDDVNLLEAFDWNVYRVLCRHRDFDSPEAEATTALEVGQPPEDPRGNRIAL